MEDQGTAVGNRGAPLSSIYTAIQERLARLINLISGVSVRTKIMGIALALTIILGVSITVQVRLMLTQTLLSELDSHGRSILRDLATRSAALLRAQDQTTLHQLLTDAVDHYPDLHYAFVVTDDDQVLAHTFTDAVPALLRRAPAPGLRDQPLHTIHEPYDESSDAAIASHTIHDYAMRVGDVADAEGVADSVGATGGGTIHLGLSEQRLQHTVARVTRQLLLTTLLVALIGILAAIGLTWLLTRPILDLVTTTNQVRQGNLEIRAPHWTDDEIGSLADAFNQLISELQSSQQTVADKEVARTHLLSRLIDAQEDERKRLARELHDDVGQALTSMLVQLKLLQQSTANDTASKTLNQLRQIVDQTLTTVRLISRQLRPSLLDDLGLKAALERHGAEFTSRYPTISIDLHCELDERLPAAVGISLYRIIQEAMTNAARHSGATLVSVLVMLRANRVQAIIEDNGHGFPVSQTLRAKNSVGLHSMTERSELLNGKIQIESNPDGTTIFVEIPL